MFRISADPSPNIFLLLFTMFLAVVKTRRCHHFVAECCTPHFETLCWHLQICCTICEPLPERKISARTYHNFVAPRLPYQSGVIYAAIEYWHLRVLTTVSNVVNRHSDVGGRTRNDSKHFVWAAKWVLKLGQKWWQRFSHQNWCYYFLPNFSTHLDIFALFTNYVH